MQLSFKSIGHIHSPFKDKVLIPRNSGLCPLIRGQIILDSSVIEKDFLKDLDGVSHLWVIFYFHQIKENFSKATVRPPRLGGEKRIGTFATRSPYRPNPIGLSLVKLESINRETLSLEISGHDFLEGTPVLDLKPYVSYADLRENTNVDWLGNQEIVLQDVFFNHQNMIDEVHLKEIEQILAVYPRSSVVGKVIKSYYGNYDLRWSQEINGIKVHKILIEK